MCGIVGYVGTKHKTTDVLIMGLKSLEYRGYDSAGIAYFNANQIKSIKEVGRVEKLEEKVENDDASIGIAHTRWATHGRVTKENAHPHTQNKFTIVHNGIIENYQELKNKLVKEGYHFLSETDSEVLVALLDSLYQKDKNILKAINQLKEYVHGSYALGILCQDDKDTLYAIRKDSPLIVGIEDHDYFIASDVPAILRYTNKYILLENDEIVALSKNGLNIYNEKLKKQEKEILTFEGNMHAAEKCGYEHFMLKEIYEQPEVIHNLVYYYLNAEGDDFSNKLPSLIKYKKMHVIACGSAYHTGLVFKNLVEAFCDIEVLVEIASEYRYKKSFYDKDTLVIVISQSGETADTLAALRKAKQDCIDTLAIVNVVGSSIAREADKTLYIYAGCEIAVATTKAYSAQLALLSLLALKLSYEKKLITEEEKNTILKEFINIGKQMKKLLNNDYESIVRKIYNKKDIFFIGRGMDYSMSMEGALKLKEISYINAVSYAAGELKHGTISLIETNTPILAMNTDEKLKEKMISNIKEVKARGAMVIYITNEEVESDFYDEKIILPKTSLFIQSLLTILPLQLIAYYTAKMNGCDIDKPKNLAKSVTVE